MTPDELIAAMDQMQLDDRGLARAMGLKVDKTGTSYTVMRWRLGRNPIPAPMAKLIRYMLDENNRAFAKIAIDGDQQGA